ncbi:hypothetical protein DdX_03315 [Ditylenchus destructor]|uniref:Uncharacterized protein n=1 Tax=Ditylenchus destructor TaxID=166010 RepID=A0AAD4NE48_9BILA|nr:hypothetical protein DdX_03315 [Ditylenchus destructor]
MKHNATFFDYTVKCSFWKRQKCLSANKGNSINFEFGFNQNSEQNGKVALSKANTFSQPDRRSCYVFGAGTDLSAAVIIRLGGKKEEEHTGAECGQGWPKFRRAFSLLSPGIIMLARRGVLSPRCSARFSLVPSCRLQTRFQVVPALEPSVRSILLMQLWNIFLSSCALLHLIIEQHKQLVARTAEFCGGENGRFEEGLG